MDTSSIVEIVASLADAKKREEIAKAERLELEAKLVAAVNFKKPEGSETFEFASPLGSCKFSLKQPVTRSVSELLWPGIFDALSPTERAAAVGVMRAKFELATKEARELEESNPSLWRKVAACVSSKPGKVSVEIKESTLL